MKVTILDFETYNHRKFPQYGIQLTESFTKDDARREYHDCLDRLRRALERLGVHNSFGEGDFVVGSDWYAPHRSIGFEISSDKLLTPKLVPSVQSLIRSFSYPYLVDVGYDPFLRGSAHRLSSYDFFATIEVDSIMITTKKELVLKLLGLHKGEG
jgi:hypothetical protein